MNHLAVKLVIGGCVLIALLLVGGITMGGAVPTRSNTIAANAWLVFSLLVAVIVGLLV